MEGGGGSLDAGGGSLDCRGRQMMWLTTKDEVDR